MKILVLALNYHPEIVGCAKFTTEFVDWVSKKSKKVVVITTNAFYPKWECKFNRYKKSLSGNVLIVRCPIYVPKKVNGLKRIIHYLSFFVTSMPIVFYFGLKNFDLALTMCPTILSSPSIIFISFIKKYLFRKKLVTWIHYQDLEIEAAFKLNFLKSKSLKKLLLLYEKIILSNFDLISSISSYMLEKIKKNTPKKKKTFFLPNFIDSSEFNYIYENKKTNPYLKELSLDKGNKVIMYSGSINEKLACKTLINSIKNLSYRKDLIWIICGDGPKRSFLKKSLKNFKNVLFYDFQPINKLPYWLDIADIHLIPQKLTSVEFCLPSKLLGILAIGKTVIGIAPVNSELGNVLDKYGFRLSSENSSEMSKAIIKLIENKDLRNKLSDEGKIYIKRFHEKEKILKDIFEEVQKLISKY